MRTKTNLENEIVADLKIELGDDESFSENKLKAKVHSAIIEVQEARCYGNSSLGNAQIEDDLWNYYSTIRKIALFDYNQIGVEYENSHSENGISRSYEKRSSLLNGVCAFVKVI